MRVCEISVKRIRVNQGLDVHIYVQKWLYNVYIELIFFVKFLVKRTTSHSVRKGSLKNQKLHQGTNSSRTLIASLFLAQFLIIPYQNILTINLSTQSNLRIKLQKKLSCQESFIHIIWTERSGFRF